MTSVKSRTSEGLEESYITDNKDSSQILTKRRVRNAYTKGKGYNNEDSGENSVSNDNGYSME